MGRFGVGIFEYGLGNRLEKVNERIKWNYKFV